MLLTKIKDTRFLTSVALCALLILSLPPRLWELSSHPPIIVDEPAYLRDIDKMIANSDFNPTNFQWDFSQATLAYYPSIIIIKIFNITDKVLALRYTSVIFSLLALIPIFFIIKNRSNLTIAFCSTLLFSLSYYYLQFSRVGWGVVYTTTLGLYLIWILEKALNKLSLTLLVISGFIGGLILYGYRGGQIYIITAFFLALIKIFFSSMTTSNKILFFTVFSSFFLFVSMPWIYKIATNWDQYNLRSRVVSVTSNPLPYHGLYESVSIWDYQIRTTFKSWILLEPVSGGGIENIRYLPLKVSPVNQLIKFLFWLGIILALIKFKKNWWWFSVLTLGLFFGQILTVDPPNGARGLVILPVIYIFSSSTLYFLYQKLGYKRIVLLFYLLISLLIAYSDFIYYQNWMTWIGI